MVSTLRICVFAFLLIEISSRKAVPEVTKYLCRPFILSFYHFKKTYFFKYCPSPGPVWNAAQLPLHTPPTAHRHGQTRVLVKTPPWRIQTVNPPRERHGVPVKRSFLRARRCIISATVTQTAQCLMVSPGMSDLGAPFLPFQTPFPF